jgi:hypothetical protein
VHPLPLPPPLLPLQAVEYAFVSADWARQVYHWTHCPEATRDAADLGGLYTPLKCNGH